MRRGEGDIEGEGQKVAISLARQQSRTAELNEQTNREFELGGTWLGSGSSNAWELLNTFSKMKNIFLIESVT